MTRRIAIWAISGLGVAGLWALHATISTPPALTSADPLLPWAEFTCPIAAASLHLNFGVSLFWVLLANLTTYALVGALVETLRHRFAAE